MSEIVYKEPCDNDNYEKNPNAKHDHVKFIEEIESLHRQIQIFEYGFIMLMMFLCPLLKYFGLC